MLAVASGVAPPRGGRQAPSPYAAAHGGGGLGHHSSAPKALVRGWSTPGDALVRQDGSVLVSPASRRLRLVRRWVAQIQRRFPGCRVAGPGAKGACWMWQWDPDSSAPFSFIWSYGGRRAWRQRHPGLARAPAFNGQSLSGLGGDLAVPRTSRRPSIWLPPALASHAACLCRSAMRQIRRCNFEGALIRRQARNRSSAWASCCASPGMEPARAIPLPPARAKAPKVWSYGTPQLLQGLALDPLNGGSG